MESSWHHNVFALAAECDIDKYCFGSVNPNSRHLLPTSTASSCNDVWDSALEETFHMVQDGGAAEVYPGAWEDKNITSQVVAATPLRIQPPPNTHD